MVAREQEKSGVKKTVVIIVNGRPKEVAGKALTYEEVLSLAFNDDPPTGPNIVITVTFSRGEDSRKDGSLLPGESVKIKKGMVFDVTATDKS